MTTATTELTVAPFEFSPIREDRLWSNWPQPIAIKTHIRDLQVEPVSDDFLRFTVQETGEDGILAPVSAGIATNEALTNLSLSAIFPPEFVSKLPTPLRASVINERITNQALTSKRKDDTYTLVREGAKVVSILPGRRDLLPYDQTTERVFQLLDSRYSDIEVKYANVTNEGLSARFLVPNHQEIITPALGDVMSFGVELTQNYGGHINLDLYTQRLVCLNGMQKKGSQFRWGKGESGGTVEQQLEWLQEGVNFAVREFANLSEKARLMANTRAIGDTQDPQEVLRNRMRAMGVSARYFDQIWAAYLEEPGQSEWHLLNAFTRVATHNLNRSEGTTLQRQAGDWTSGFEIVTATLPRVTANRVHAHIIDTIPVLEGEFVAA